MPRIIPYLLFAAGLGLSACGGGGDSPADTPEDVSDASDVDDTVDVVPDGDEDAETGDADDVADGDDVEETVDGTDAGPDAKRTAVSPTAGGGQIQSANFRLRVFVGTPQPMGSASASAHSVRLGPAAQSSQ